MHNKVWGSAEILANSVETIVFVNTLHPLPEAFLAFFSEACSFPLFSVRSILRNFEMKAVHLSLVRFLKLQGFIALPHMLDLLCNFMLSY